MPTAAAANGGPTDDSKIRLQLALDVEYLGEQVGGPSGAREHKLTSTCNLNEPLHGSVFSQIQKMGLQPSDISMFSTLMDLIKEARELTEQNQ